MDYDQFDSDYWNDASDLEDILELTPADIAAAKLAKYLSRRDGRDLAKEGWRNPNYGYVVFDKRLHLVDVATGELVNYADANGDKLAEFDVSGYPSIENNILEMLSAEDANSAGQLNEISNLLGDKHTYRLFNGLEEYASTLNKSSFSKLMQLCLSVNRRNTAFITRETLCDLLSTTPKNLSRVLGLMVNSGFIKFEKAELQAHTLKIQINPCFVWKGYPYNRSSAMYHQGFTPISKKKEDKPRRDWNLYLVQELAAFEEWKKYNESDNDGIDALMLAEIEQYERNQRTISRHQKERGKPELFSIPMHDVLRLGDCLFKENYQHWLKVVNKSAGKADQYRKKRN